MKSIGVVRERGWVWHATTEDPRYIFSLRFLRPQFLFIFLEPLNEPLDPVLFLDRGHGFNEGESLSLVCAGPTGYIVSLKELREVSAIRFDPCSATASFQFWAKRLHFANRLDTFLERLTTDLTAKKGYAPRFQHIGKRDATSMCVSDRLAIARTTKDHFSHVMMLAKQRTNTPICSTGSQQVPFISLVVPVYNTPPKYLKDLVESFHDQGTAYAELVLSDDGSTLPATLELLNTLRGKPGIKVLIHSTNTGIAGATNRGIASASGQWVGLVDHDDALSSCALEQVFSSIQRFPDAKFFYTDEVITNPKLEPVGYILKPAYDPVLLSGVNYINHLSIYRRDLLNRIGNVREGFEGSQDYDLLLRYLTNVPPSEVVHIPFPAYKWRRVSTSFSTKFQDQSVQSARRGLADHFAPAFGTIPIVAALDPTLHRPRLDAAISDWPSVSIVIPSRDAFPLISLILENLRDKTDYPNLEIIVVDNGSRDSRVLDLYAAFGRSFPKFTVSIEVAPFNFAGQINRGIRLAKGKHVLLLNNDVEVQSADWLKEMVSCLAYHRVGIVGSRLLYPDRTLQHAGVIVGFGDYAGHWFERKPEKFPGPFARLMVRQSLSAVTGACMLISRDCLDAVGLLDEDDFAIAYNDVDYCLRACGQGFRIVWTPFASLIHHESASRGSDETPENRQRFAREKKSLQDRYRTAEFCDPAISPWYSRDRSNPCLVMLNELPPARTGWHVRQ